MRPLRKALKYVLPFGLVEMTRNRRTLREYGRDVSLRDEVPLRHSLSSGVRVSF